MFRFGAGSVKALRGPVTGFAGWRDCWNQLDWGRIRFVGNDLVFVPVVSFSGRALYMTFPPSQYRQTAPILTTIPLSGGRSCTGRVKTSHKTGAEPRFFLPPKKFGKRSGVFQILMPTAPTRIKPRLPALSAAERYSREEHTKRTGAVFASRPEIRKMLWHFLGFSALRITDF